MKRWLYLTLIALLLLFALLAWSPAGPLAVRWLAPVWVEDLAIGGASGTLADHFVLRDVAYRDEKITARFGRIGLNIGWRCLVRKSLCIEQLELDNSWVEVRAPAQTTPPPASMSQPQRVVSSPLPLSLGNVSVNNFDLVIEQQLSIKLATLSAKAAFDQALVIPGLTAQKLHIDVLSAPSPEQTESEFSPLKPQPLVLPLAFDLDNIQLQDILITRQQQADIRINKLAFATAAQMHDVDLQIGELAAADLQMAGQAKATLNSNYPLDAELSGQWQHGQFGSNQFVMSLQGNLSALQGAVKLSGDQQLDATIVANLGAEHLPLQAQLNWPGLQFRYQDTTLALSQGSLSAIGDLQQLALELDSQLEAQGLPSATVDVSALLETEQLTINDMQVATLGGLVLTTGTARWQQQLQWQGETRLSDINPGTFWPDYQASLSGTLNVDGQLGEQMSLTSLVDIEGTLRQFPMALTGQLNYQGKQMEVVDLQANNGDNTLLVNGKLDGNDNIDIRLDIDASDLNQTFPFARGSVNGQVQASDQLQSPRIAIALNGEDLGVHQFHIQQLDAEGELLPFSEQTSNLTITALQGATDNPLFELAQLSLSGNSQQHDLKLQIQGHDADLDTLLSGALSQHGWQGQLSRGRLRQPGLDMALQQSAELRADWQQQAYVLDPHCWVDQQTQVCLQQASFADNQGNWQVNVEQWPIDTLLHWFADGPFTQSESRLSLQTQGSWLADRGVEGQLSAVLSEGEWRYRNAPQQGLTMLDSHVNANFSANQIVVDSHIVTQTAGSLLLNATLPWQAQSVSANGNVTLEQIELSPLQPLFTDLQQLSGRLFGQLQFDGELTRPELTGELNVRGLELSGEGLPVSIQDMNQQLRLTGNTGDLSGDFIFGDGRGEIAGNFNWAPDWAFDIQLSGQDLAIRPYPGVDVQISPDLNLAYQPDHIALTGVLAVPAGNIEVLQQAKSGRYPSSDVVIINEQQHQQQGPTVDLSVQVAIDPTQQNKVNLQAYGLNANLQGDLYLNLVNNALAGNGAVQLVDGRYRAYGQNLVIRNGVLQFVGPLDNPLLQFEAIRDPSLTEDDVIAGLRIDGLAQTAELSLFSEPPMEQQQNLSYLLTGKSLDTDRSADQDTLLTNALLGFGLGRTAKFTGNLGDKLGIDDLTLDTSGQGQDTQLMISGYIAPGFQLRYGVGVFNSVSEVALRYELSRDLYLEAVSGLNNALDLYFSFAVGDEEAPTDTTDSASSNDDTD